MNVHKIQINALLFKQCLGRNMSKKVKTESEPLMGVETDPVACKPGLQTLPDAKNYCVATSPMQCLCYSTNYRCSTGGHIVYVVE